MGFTIIIGLLGAIWTTRENLLEEALISLAKDTHLPRYHDCGTSTYDLYTPESQIKGDFLITE